MSHFSVGPWAKPASVILCLMGSFWSLLYFVIGVSNMSKPSMGVRDLWIVGVVCACLSVIFGLLIHAAVILAT